MMPPPGGLPNFSMPPPGFAPFSSDGSSGPSPAAGGNTAAPESNQELWVETKTTDGKVFLIYCNCSG